MHALQPVDVGPNARKLFGAALDASTAANLVHMAEFVSRFRGHSIFNANLIRVQRPGAQAVATVGEWQRAGHIVVSTATPIVLLWPSAPVLFAFDIADTEPSGDGAAIVCPAVVPCLTDAELLQAVDNLRLACSRHPHFRLEVIRTMEGFGGTAPVVQSHNPGGRPWELIDELVLHAGVAWVADVEERRGARIRKIPVYRITIDPRLSPSERLIALAYQCGRVFLGHLGPCTGQSGEIAGWPDRRGLDAHVAAIETDAVAWIVAARAGLIVGAADYLTRHEVRDNACHVDVALVERAASRFERLAQLNYRR